MTIQSYTSKVLVFWLEEGNLDSPLVTIRRSAPGILVVEVNTTDHNRTIEAVARAQAALHNHPELLQDIKMEDEGQ